MLLQGTLGMKNERILRQLIEMVELDSSEYVRLMVSATSKCVQHGETSEYVRLMVSEISEYVQLLVSMVS